MRPCAMSNSTLSAPAWCKLPRTGPARGRGDEHLDGLKLVHMNGQVYDLVIGRFLSTDPAYQNLAGSQALNRYSYVLNNPLSYTDPSGYFFKKIFKAIKRFVSSAAKTLKKAVAKVGKTITKALAKNKIVRVAVVIAVAAAGGFASGLVASGGDLKSAAISAVTATAFAGVHFAPVGGEGSIGRIAAHAAVGGTVEELRGGKFAHGALASAVGHGVSAHGPGSGLAGTVTAAVSGGVAAELGGGKFANGAATGAFGHLYNHDLVGRHTTASLVPLMPNGQQIMSDASSIFLEVLSWIMPPLRGVGVVAMNGGGGAARLGIRGGGGRGANFYRPDPDAAGAPHTVFRTNRQTGRIENYETFDPLGLSGGNKRFRGSGTPHGGVEPPLVLEPRSGHPGGRPSRARPARTDELPLGF